MLPNDLIIVRNHGCAEESKRRSQQVGDATEFRFCGDPIQFGIPESELKSNSEFRTTLNSN
jgi:hypothetical protein